MKRSPNIPKLDRESVLEASKLSDAEARFLVSNYYQSQDMRKRSDMQIRHLGPSKSVGIDAVDKPPNPPKLLKFTADTFASLENDMKKGLQTYAESSLVGRWCLAQHGIGPVIAAGMIAHLDIEEAPTAGHFWRFAGLDPSCKWEEGKKRPYNAELKQLTFHFGECAKRFNTHPDCFYGHIYKARKEFLVERNDAGHNAERAKTFFTKSADWKKVLKTGKLPDGNIDRQACNYSAKMFLSHLHAVMYWDKYKKAPPKPFAIMHLGHAHEVRVPFSEMFPGFNAAYYGEKKTRTKKAA